VFEARRGSHVVPSSLKVTPSSLENGRYVVKIDANGDVASIVDKQVGKELLSEPSRLAVFDDPSPSWPAWEILWDTVSKPPRAFVEAPVVRVVERGPARVAIEVARKAAGSTITQRISLSEGGERVEFATDVDWRTPGTLLKVSFPMTARNPRATYDLGLGTIERANDTASLYEVPAQQWADLTDAGGGFGMAVMSDAKYGWDKPGDNELRLTLIHTPLPKTSFTYQSSNDLGRHRFTYAVAGHASDWRQGAVPVQAARLNQPLVAFQTGAHDGPLGRSLSLVDLEDSGGQVAVRAVKKAEESDEVVVRVQELYGRPAKGLRLGLGSGIQQAREINAAEEPVGEATVDGGKLAIDLGPYQPRTFAVSLRPPAERVAAVTSAPVPLPFNLDGVSSEANRADGDFDGQGHTFPAEQLPSALEIGGVTFRFGDTKDGARNVVAARGQRVPLPDGAWNRAYVLAAAVEGDAPNTPFSLERRRGSAVPARLEIQDWVGPIGQWYSRLVSDTMLRKPFVPEFKDQSWPLAEIESQIVTRFQPGAAPVVQGIDQIRPGFVKRAEVAWASTHRHAPREDEIYIFGYVFKYELSLPANASAIGLPANPRVRVLAISVANVAAPGTRPAGLLYAPDLPAPAPPRPTAPAR
jgi:alpha-mannosidase